MKFDEILSSDPIKNEDQMILIFLCFVVAVCASDDENVVVRASDCAVLRELARANPGLFAANASAPPFDLCAQALQIYRNGIAHTTGDSLATLRKCLYPRADVPANATELCVGALHS